MQTHRETILQRVVSLLGPSGTPVFRSRVEALQRGELPAIVVRPGAEAHEQTATRLVKRTFQIVIEVHAAADSSVTPNVAADQAADPVIAQIHASLFVNSTLDGIVAALFDKEMQEPLFADGDETRVSITLVYEAVYMTRSSDITIAATH